jgi:hypothetical protein
MARHDLAAAERIGDVMHACPECILGQARIECPTCHGAGAVTELGLDLFVRRQERLAAEGKL